MLCLGECIDSRESSNHFNDVGVLWMASTSLWGFGEPTLGAYIVNSERSLDCLKISSLFSSKILRLTICGGGVVICQSFSQCLIFLFWEAFSFLFFIKIKQGWVGGWDFLSSQVYCLPTHSIQYCNYGFSALFYITVSFLNFQLGICMLIKVIRYSAMFPCFKIKI